MSKDKQDAERRELEDLLPWHAAGTLSRRDARRLEEALARDPELARRYEIVREELAGTIHLNETLGAPSARAMEKLFAKIEAEPARRHRASFGLGARISEFLAGLSPGTLAWAGGAAALLILLQAGLIGSSLLKQPGTGYETASAPGAHLTQGSLVLVRFAPQASAADVTSFLEANKASIVDGPSGGGFYRIRVAETVLSNDELSNVINKIQEDKVIAFVAATR